MKNDAISPEILHQLLILKSLIAMGGFAERNRVLSHVKLHYENLLSKKDLEDYESGHGERWKNHMSFAMQHLIEKGCLAKGSSYGIWEITDEGRRQYTEWLEALKQNLPQSE